MTPLHSHHSQSRSRPDDIGESPHGFAQAAEQEAARKPKKSGGFFRKFILLLLLLAAASGAYFYHFDRDRVIALLPPFLTPLLAPEESTPVDSTQPTPTPTPTQPTQPTRPAPDSSPPLAERGNPARMELLSSELAALRGEFARMESRLNQVDAVARTARAADAANIRLLLVGLLLESNGDTQAAASALRRIADSAAPQSHSLSPELAQLVRAEALRLEQTPHRGRILNQIDELRALLQRESIRAADDSNAASEKVGRFLRDAFNISRRGAADKQELARAEILNHLARMEFFLAANNRPRYRESLSTAAELWESNRGDGSDELGGSDPNISLKFELLREFGAPDYRLNLPLDKP